MHYFDKMGWLLFKWVLIANSSSVARYLVVVINIRCIWACELVSCSVNYKPSITIRPDHMVYLQNVFLAEYISRLK